MKLGFFFFFFKIPQKWCCVLLRTSSQGCMIGLIIGDINLEYLVKVVSVRSLHCKITIFPFIVIYWMRYSETLLKFCFLSKFHPLVIASIRFCLQLLLLWCLLNGHCFFSFLLSLLIGVFLYKGDITYLTLIYIFSYRFGWVWLSGIYLFYRLYCIWVIQYYHDLFC